jgi:hypothetical protein
MTTTLKKITELLSRCGHREAVLPATALFNEGWMLRLVLDWCARHPDAIPELRFLPGSRWYSEALLGSRFRPRSRGDAGGEGFTHADAVIGHFDVLGRGDVRLRATAQQLVVVEAKMGSGLSPGTSRAPTFNQAARNVACVAHLLGQSSASAQCDADLGFVIVAPKARIDEQIFKAAAKDHIEEAVAARCHAFDDAATRWHCDVFLPVLRRMRIDLLSWEEILERLEETDSEEAKSLSHFYRECQRYNLVDRQVNSSRQVVPSMAAASS